MTATVFTESSHAFDGLLESEHNVSIDEIIVAQSQTVTVGALLGAVAVTGDLTLVGAANPNNVGTSTIGSIFGTSASMNGTYSILSLTGGSTGEFEVHKPDGSLDGVGKIGTAYSGSITFTITAGGTPTAGDNFTINVVRPFDEAGEQFVAWSPTATDGSQVPAGIALANVTTSTGQTKKIAALRRNGAFRSSAVQWPTGATTAQKATAQQQLAERKVTLR